jgi:hypothetical protein
MSLCPGLGANVHIYSGIRMEGDGQVMRITANMSALTSGVPGIVKAFCLQTLSNFAELDPPLRKRVIERLKHITEHESPAMKSRSRKLIAELT